MDGNDRLEELLQQILQDADAQAQLSRELGIEPAAGNGGPAKEVPDEQ
jgi:predicted component of type VI protein secretion system